MILKNQNLYNFNQEIQEWKQSGSILLFLNRSKIADFWTHNTHKINTIHKGVENIQREYFVFYEVPNVKNEDGSIKEDIKFEGEGKDRKPVLNEGKNIEDFNRAITEFMQQDVDVKF